MNYYNEFDHNAASSFLKIVRQKMEYRIDVLRKVCELKQIPDFADIKNVFKNMTEKQRERKK